MIELIWSEKFKKNYKKWIEKHPDFQPDFHDSVMLFTENPFHPFLKTHSLSGVLKSYWAFSINYSQRVIFQFLNDKQTLVMLIAIGSHDEGILEILLPVRYPAAQINPSGN